MDHSLCFGVLKGDELIGLARVITDRATFAYITHVVIAEDARGQGLGHWLTGRMLEHPDLQGLRRICLVTGDAVDLYADFGFEPGAEHSRTWNGEELRFRQAHPPGLRHLLQSRAVFSSASRSGCLDD